MSLETTSQDLGIANPESEGLLIDAKSDEEAIRRYLSIRCQKATTRNAVQRDLRKFAVFMHLYDLGSLSALKAEHCLAFQAWLMAPEELLCAGNGRPPPLSKEIDGKIEANPDWRPFRAPLSPVSTNQCVDKIKAMYSWLVDAGYLKGNPWTLIKPVTKATTKSADEYEDGDERELPLRCIQAVLHFLDHGQEMAGPKQMAHWRWIFYFYLYTAARISSGCSATIDDIYTNRKGHDQLTLTVKGAGIRRKDVPWIPELEREYQRYRAAMGLNALVIPRKSQRRQPNEALPSGKGPRHLILPLRIGPKALTSEALSYQSIHGHIVALFRMTRAWVVSNPDFELEDWELSILQDATGHWIRHGTATLLGVHAKSQLGHASQQQTDVYQAAEAKRHRERLRQLLAPEEEPYATLLEEPLSVRRIWVERLMASIDQEAPDVLEEIWAHFLSSHD